MRMKKVLILAAVAAIAATACNKTYEVNPTPEVPIGFGSWANTLTKGYHDPSGSTNFAVNDAFNVYGTKTVGSTTSDVFVGTTVTKTADSPEAWTYSPTRYWDQTATSYTFYAVAPDGLLDGSGASATTAGIFTSEPIVFLGGDTQKTDIKDILVAAQTTVNKTGSPAAFASPVTLPFYHIASLLDLKVQKHNDLELAGEDANNYIKVAVTAISLSNIDGTGHFSISSYGASSPFAPETDGDTWTEETSAEKKTYNHTSGYDTVTLPTDVNAVSASSPNDLISKLVVMPQDFRTDGTADQTVNITYTIETCENGNSSTTAVTTSFDLKEFDTAQDYDNKPANYIASWMPGTHYIYVITIGANAITFNATIQNWAADQNGYHYLIQ